MADTKRYIIGHRRGPRLDPKSTRELDTFIAENADARSVRKTKVGRQVVEMTEEQARDLAGKNPDLVIEEDQELKMYGMPGIPPRVPSAAEAVAFPVVVKDANTGAPVPNVTIYGIGAAEVAYKAVTDEKGQATLQSYEPTLVQIIASPLDTYWSKAVSNVKAQGKKHLEITVKPLLSNGAYDWGQRIMGFRQANRSWTGREVKVGIIDSGISDKNKSVTAAGGYNAIDGADPNSWNVDEKGHGTHVAGIIAAHDEQRSVLGGAPDASVYSLKIFPGGFLSDLVESVEWCISSKLDIISMSLGVPNPSQVLAGVLRDAYDRGITCVAAAGNESAAVAYPAAIPTVIAVGAIGCFGTFPEDSAHMLKVSRTLDWRGGLFAAKFTNFGPEVAVCAPGVAILSTVPTGYAAWDGTSMACPMISALVALMLEAYPGSRTGDAQQPEFVRAMLAQAAYNLGMPPQIQGHGLPLAPRALASAQPAPGRW